MTLAWVLGGTGLLGSALRKELIKRGTTLYEPHDRFSWGKTQTLDAQLVAAVKAFTERLSGVEEWEIYWAAGVGTMASQAVDLVPETVALERLLRLLESEPALKARSGAFAFASSAGALYAGSHDTPITENSAAAPTTAYARAKLEQEALVQAFASTQKQTWALLARISTVYGAGQSTGKRQGLLTHVARSMIRNQPIQIYVPFDTIRDYITAGDTAASMVSSLRALATGPSGAAIKIIASEQPTTIAEIVALFGRVSRRKPLVVTSASTLSALYTRHVQFHSVVLAKAPSERRTSLLIGIAEVLAAERTTYARATSPREMA